MDFHADTDENHVVGNPNYLQPVPLLLGRKYDSIDDARQAIKHQLQDSGLPSATKFSNKIRFCLVCPQSPHQCDFIVTARLQKKTGLVHVIKCNLTHSCGITFEASASRPSAGWICKQVNELMTDVPNATPAGIRNHIKRRFGVIPSYITAWRAACAARKNLNSDEEVAFQLIEPLFRKLRESMDGTVAVMQRDVENRLLRTFVMLQPLVNALLFCKPILSFDACALKGKYKGVLMAATMIDGAGQILPLAWGTAPIENTDNWTWFAQHLRHGLPQTQQAVKYSIFSDREKGIEEALLQSFPESFHFYCMKHIEKNILTNFQYRNNRILWTAAKAIQRRHFDEAMATIQRQNPAVHRYLMQIPLEKWATSFALHPKWKHVTSNSSESLNSWMLDIRDVSHIGLHLGMVQKCTILMYDRRTLYNNINTLFPRSTTTELENIRRTGRTLPVVRSSDTVFTINDYAVDLSGPIATCQCGTSYQTGMPCIHIAAVQTNLMDMVHPSYLTTTIRLVYAGIIPPTTVHDLVPDGETMPQAQRRQVGRPKVVRTRSRSEYLPTESPYQCSACGFPGHNKRTCQRRQLAAERQRDADVRRQRAEERRQQQEEGQQAQRQAMPHRRGRGRPRRNHPT
jgi:MULE transposase domain